MYLNTYKIGGVFFAAFAVFAGNKKKREAPSFVSSTSSRQKISRQWRDKMPRKELKEIKEFPAKAAKAAKGPSARVAKRLLSVLEVKATAKNNHY